MGGELINPSHLTSWVSIAAKHIWPEQEVQKSLCVLVLVWLLLWSPLLFAIALCPLSICKVVFNIETENFYVSHWYFKLCLASLCWQTGVIHTVVPGRWVTWAVGKASSCLRLWSQGLSSWGAWVHCSCVSRDANQPQEMWSFVTDLRWDPTLFQSVLHPMGCPWSHWDSLGLCWCQFFPSISFGHCVWLLKSMSVFTFPLKSFL